MKCIAVITTVGGMDEARTVARSIVERRLAACAQLEQIESFYTWNDALQQDPEIRITFKTTSRRYNHLERALKEIHPYELPAIHAVACKRIEPAYEEWIIQNTEEA